MFNRNKNDFLSLVSILLSIVNGGLFWFWFYIVKCDLSLQVKWIDPIAIQFGIMNVMLICVSIFLVVVSFFGYSGVSTIATDVAKRAATAEADRQMAKFLAHQKEENERDTDGKPFPQDKKAETNKSNPEESV